MDKRPSFHGKIRICLLLHLIPRGICIVDFMTLQISVHALVYAVLVLVDPSSTLNLHSLGVADLLNDGETIRKLCSRIEVVQPYLVGPKQQ